ncbi:MAG: hemerythrin domain-containing protein [Candidatus Nealsonbacteria bacterium]|nr:hemerythrin domain-containing protein [Candidatus Nealsonbacteria bacterium]
MDKCPGQDFQNKPAELRYIRCSNCGNEVEFWPRDHALKCDKCGCEVRTEAIPSCADWCEYAKECLGEEKYKQYQKSKNMTHCCGNHNCIEELRADHEKILTELDKLEADPEGYAKTFLEFTESFAEPHHHKEEEVLFPALEKKGIPKDGGPIGVMLMEHEMKRGYVKELAAGKIEAAMKIVSLMRDHIAKENDILYPMAQQVLTEEELAGMGHLCEEIKNRK